MTDVADRTAARGSDGPAVRAAPPSAAKPVAPAPPVAAAPLVAVAAPQEARAEVSTARPVPTLPVSPIGTSAPTGTVEPTGAAKPAKPPEPPGAAKPPEPTGAAKPPKRPKAGKAAKKATGGEAVPARPTAAPAEPDLTGPGFAPGMAAKLRAYVYLLIDPRTGRPFYVGTGRGDRCFHHLRAARDAPVGGPPPTDAKGTPWPLVDRIREIEVGTREVRIDLLRYGLTGEEAALVEAVANDVLGLPVGGAVGSQRGSVVEVGSRLAKRAKFKRAHQVVLLRVGGHGSGTGYDLVRHHWRIARRWTDLESPRSPRWAVVVAGDLVDSVYRIEAWEPSRRGAHSPRLPAGADRYSFTGSRDEELEARYAGRSVAPYLGTGAQSPVTYVWCGPHWVNSAH